MASPKKAAAKPKATTPKAVAAKAKAVAPGAETFTVTIPSTAGHVGVIEQHGVTFSNGVAHGVKKGMALDDFRDWGYEVIPEFAIVAPVEEPAEPTEPGAPAEEPAE